MSNIKETKEMIAALGELSFTGGRIMKDGKFDMGDIAHLPELIMKFPILEMGFKDIDKAKEEIQHLDQAEVVELIGAIYAAVNRFSEGKK